MKNLYFIRHGLSELNVKGRFAGHTETPLTKIGRAQAKKSGKEAKGLNIDCIVSSPLSRAIETAEIIAREIGYNTKNIHINNLLIERNFGELENKPYSPDINLDGFSDLESDNEILARAKLAAEWIDSLPAENILVVSHGSLGRALRKHYLPKLDFHSMIPNAEIIHFM